MESQSQRKKPGRVPRPVDEAKKIRRENSKKVMHRRREWCRENGWCTKCTAREAIAGTSHCTKCTEYNEQYKERARERMCKHNASKAT